MMFTFIAESCSDVPVANAGSASTASAGAPSRATLGAEHIAFEVGLAASTVHAILRADSKAPG